MSAQPDVPALCLDPNAVCYEVVFSMPYTQKFATFRGQRKRFTRREYAKVFVKLHKHTERGDMKQAIIKGTMAEIDAMPNRITVDALNTLLDEPLDYGDGRMAHQCEWKVMEIDPAKPSDIKDVVNEFEPMMFGTKNAAMACAKFMEQHCVDVIASNKQFATAHVNLANDAVDQIFVQKRHESK